jgi:arylsulfatase A-like enzyme
MATNDRPNVLFISFDDMNHYVGFLDRAPHAVTPHMNRLAERSTVFERAYCQAPICNPSRASLMSGLRPSTTGIYTNRQPLRFSEAGETCVTLPQYFRQNGYLTTGSGKVYHGKFSDPMSWNSYVPGTFNQTFSGAAPDPLPVNGMADMGNLDWGPMDVADDQMSDYRSVSYCVEQLQAQHEKPFFLTCGFTTPHLMWHAPRKYIEQYRLDDIVLPEVMKDDLEDVSETGRKWANREPHKRIVDAGKWKEAIRCYLGCISYADMLIGRLLGVLGTSAYANNTVIVLWSDHGWHLGEKEHWKKSTLWEEATRIPLLFSAPGYLPGRCAKPVGLIDVYPTLVELCDLPERETLEGLSLVPLMANPDREWTRPAVTTHGYKNHAVRSEKWRYIQYADGSEELYDHDSDEMEWHNLADDPAFEEVLDRLSQWLPETDAPDAEVVDWPEDQDLYESRIMGLMDPELEKPSAESAE